MKRVLISQNENNNGTEYIIVNGKIEINYDRIVEYGRILSKTDDWEEIHNEDFLEIRKNEKQLLIKSFYKDKDIVGRSIYYLYLIDENDNYDLILDYLEQDSKLINRTVDRFRTTELINKLKNSAKIKNKINTYLLIALGLAVLIYLLTK
jgi:hypothetical protein